MCLCTHVILLSAFIEFSPLELNLDISGLHDGMGQQNQTHCTMVMSNFGCFYNWIYYKWYCIRKYLSTVIDMSSLSFPLRLDVQILNLHWLC